MGVVYFSWARKGRQNIILLYANLHNYVVYLHWVKKAACCIRISKANEVTLTLIALCNSGNNSGRNSNNLNQIVNAADAYLILKNLVGLLDAENRFSFR